MRNILTHDRRGDVIFKELRINRQISAPKVLLINQEGEQLGVMPVDTAIQLAAERDFDVVEVAPDKNPPVCRMLNYGKFRYEQQKKDREVKKKQKTADLKEIKIRPKIGVHDYGTKVNHIREFISGGHKVKISIVFRGRELVHTEMGIRLMERLNADLKEHALIEQVTKIEDKSMMMMLSPKPAREDKSAKVKNEEISLKKI